MPQQAADWECNVPRGPALSTTRKISEKRAEAAGGGGFSVEPGGILSLGCNWSALITGVAKDHKRLRLAHAGVLQVLRCTESLWGLDVYRLRIHDMDWETEQLLCIALSDFHIALLVPKLMAACS